MKNRNPAAVFFFSLITLGIYGIVWEVKTKNEMNKLGASIPTAWLIIVPFVSFYWLWKYCEGVEHVTNGKSSAVLSFVLIFLLGIIGITILQNEFNKLALAPTPDSNPLPPNQPFVPTTPSFQPDTSFGGPIAPSASPTSVVSSPTTASLPTSGPVVVSNDPALTLNDPNRPQAPQPPQIQ
jgi:hypothetical protein